jgi:hypothetical protein
MNKKFDWLKGGLMLGTVFLLAVWLVKPVGVSTEFVIVDGIFWNVLSPGLIIETTGETTNYASSNAYLNKGGGKLAAEVKNPFSYGIAFVFSMILGGALSGWFSKKKIADIDKMSPAVWRVKFGTTNNKRFLFAFIAGFLALFGARLAGGCTSGHMMSGMMQTSLSGYLFAAGAFATAIPVSILFFKSKKQ